MTPTTLSAALALLDGVDASRALRGDALIVVGCASFVVVALPIAALLLVSRAGTGGVGPLGSKRRILAASLVLALPCLLIVRGLEPYVDPERYLPTLERTSAPIVAALDRFKAERGAPPAKLDELVPGYLDAIPTTEYPGDETFSYSAWNHLDGEWQLYVYCEPFGGSSYPDLLRLVSTDRRWLRISTRP